MPAPEALVDLMTFPTHVSDHNVGSCFFKHWVFNSCFANRACAHRRPRNKGGTIAFHSFHLSLFNTHSLSQLYLKIKSSFARESEKSVILQMAPWHAGWAKARCKVVSPFDCEKKDTEQLNGLPRRLPRTKQLPLRCGFIMHICQKKHNRTGI